MRAVSTTTTVTSSDASSDFGQPVSFTARVSPEPGGGQPTGTVEFEIDGDDFDEVALAGGTAQSEAVSTLTPGDHQVRATYRPSGGFATSQGTTTQNVGLIPTSTTASTAPAPSVFQQEITIGATVSRAVGGGTVNGGTVTFYDGGSGCGSGAPLGSDQVSNGAANIHDQHAGGEPAYDLGLLRRGPGLLWRERRERWPPGRESRRDGHGADVGILDRLVTRLRYR